jgi:hypothetical protein
MEAAQRIVSSWVCRAISVTSLSAGGGNVGPLLQASANLVRDETRVQRDWAATLVSSAPDHHGRSSWATLPESQSKFDTQPHPSSWVSLVFIPKDKRLHHPQLVCPAASAPFPHQEISFESTANCETLRKSRRPGQIQGLREYVLLPPHPINIKVIFANLPLSTCSLSSPPRQGT